jgi:hypothetical protein
VISENISEILFQLLGEGVFKISWIRRTIRAQVSRPSQSCLSIACIKLLDGCQSGSCPVLSKHAMCGLIDLPIAYNHSPVPLTAVYEWLTVNIGSVPIVGALG